LRNAIDRGESELLGTIHVTTKVTMATDWLVYWLISPLGAILFAAAVGLPIIMWRLTLGSDFAAIGSKPLALGYLYAGIGLTGVNFVACYMDFSSRVASGILAESQRWSVVPGWTLYSTILTLVIVLPLLGVVGVPVVASVLKRALLTPGNIAIFTLTVWLALSGLGWCFPGNEWHRAHRLESFLMWLQNLLPGTLFIALPFMLAIYHGSRSYRLRAMDGQKPSASPQ